MASRQAPRSERTLQASMAANIRWAYEGDRRAATEPARRALLSKFEQEVDPRGELDPTERARRAANLRRAWMQKLALRSAQVRRRRAAQHVV